MKFLDIALIVLILIILIVIIYNFLAYGNDLFIYPKRKIQKISDNEYYPGSPLYDEYTDDEYSEGNDNDDGYYDTEQYKTNDGLKRYTS